MQSSHEAQILPSRVALTVHTDLKGALEEKGPAFTSRKLFISSFGLTPHFLPATSGFPSMWKRNRLSSWFSICICLLLSLFFVLATTGFYPSPHVFGFVQFHEVVSRSFGTRRLDSESLTTTKLAVSESTMTSLTSSSQVQFDNYSLILRGQRIFL
jgi:hypothetical protein